MKAIVTTQYNSPEVLQLKDVEKKTESTPALVQLKPHSARENNGLLIKAYQQVGTEHKK